MNPRFIHAVVVCAIHLASFATIQAQNAAPPIGPINRPQQASIAISPAVIMVHCKPGQSTTQTLTLTNGMSGELRFDVEAQDVVVREGKRVFLPAGQIPSSMAAGIVAAPAYILVPPGKSGSVTVTLTVPPDPSQRAVVVILKGKFPDPAKYSVSFGASLGALFTFNLSDNVKVVAGPINTTPQTETANLSLSQELENTGTEPVVPKGVVAFLDERGKRVAGAKFDTHRLLPGERLVFAATSPAMLQPGHYRVMASFDCEGQVVTNVGEFSVSQ